MPRTLGFLILAVLTPGLLCAAAPIAIHDEAVGCVPAGRFASLTARLEPADQVSRARLAFRASGNPTWSFVPMKPEGSVYRGVLPQPLGDTTQIDYYIEATSLDTTPTRSTEHTATVADHAVCEKKGLASAAAVETASITLDGGATGVPAGFAATGIV